MDCSLVWSAVQVVQFRQPLFLSAQAEHLLSHVLPCRALGGVRGSSMALPEALPAAAVGASLPGSSGTPLQGTPGGPAAGRPLRRLSNR